MFWETLVYGYVPMLLWVYNEVESCRSFYQQSKSAHFTVARKWGKGNEGTPPVTAASPLHRLCCLCNNSA